MTYPIDTSQAQRKSGRTGVGTPGTGIGEDGDPSPALGASRATPAVVLTLAKAGRANNKPNGTVESWKPGQVSPTLNVNDNTGDTRATVVTITDETHIVNEDTGCSCCPLDPKPDSARYRACGNAVTVPVIFWIGTSLLAAHKEPAVHADKG